MVKAKQFESKTPSRIKWENKPTPNVKMSKEVKGRHITPKTLIYGIIYDPKPDVQGSVDLTHFRGMDASDIELQQSDKRFDTISKVHKDLLKEINKSKASKVKIEASIYDDFPEDRGGMSETEKVIMTKGLTLAKLRKIDRDIRSDLVDIANENQINAFAEEEGDDE